MLRERTGNSTAALVAIIPWSMNPVTATKAPSVIANAPRLRITAPRPRKQFCATAFKAVPISEERRSEEHTSELKSLMRISYAVFCLKKNKQEKINHESKDESHK